MTIKNDTERFVKRIHVKTYTEKDETVRKMLYEAFEKSKQTKSVFVQPNIWRIIMGSRAGSLAAVFLLISSWLACFVLYREVTDLRKESAQHDVALTGTDDSATINFYLREHQDFVAQKASLSPAALQPLQMQVSQPDIMYYEIFNEQPDYLYPGIIVRGPSSQHQTDPTEFPAISNGHTLSLSQVQETANFDLVLPSWLHPGYKLSQIRRIEGRDAFQLLYINGIDSVSLFEQPLDGQRGLSRQDFREYAVYQNKEQAPGTILAWRDDALSYVLIGNIKMSQLMNMAQSIRARK